MATILDLLRFLASPVKDGYKPMRRRRSALGCLEWIANRKHENTEAEKTLNLAPKNTQFAARTKTSSGQYCSGVRRRCWLRLFRVWLFIDRVSQFWPHLTVAEIFLFWSGLMTPVATVIGIVVLLECSGFVTNSKR